jgi:uncharacterized protein (DUF1684 family)
MRHLILASLLALPLFAAADSPDRYRDDIAAQRQAREEGLRRPLGWLSLVGLHWIEPGTRRVGAASDNDIVLAVGPAHLGEVRLKDGVVTLALAHAKGVEVDGAQAAISEVPLRPDSQGQPTQVTFDAGAAGFNLIERDGRFALRVRDANARTRTAFAGLDYFNVDPAWRIDARFEPHPAGATIEIANVIGQLTPEPNPGAVVFERDGRTYRIEALANPDGSLFLIFADRTSGRETYGAGRFLDTAVPEEGRVQVDFNLAYSPPCAFNAFSTCPLPPPENRLDLAVRAGEKKYAGPH